MNDSSYDPSSDSLPSALKRHGIEIPEEMVAKLDQYCRQLWQWNEKLNLTRHTDYETFVTRDLVDSLELAALLEADEEILDLGTGGGVPGIVIAIIRPDVNVSLCESVAKKAKAVSRIVEALQLIIPVHHQRAENLLPFQRYNTIIARAVAPLPKMLTWLEPHWNSFDRLLAIKGSRWVTERSEARHQGLLKSLELRKAATYTTPGTDAESVILKIWPSTTEEQAPDS